MIRSCGFLVVFVCLSTCSRGQSSIQFLGESIDFTLKRDLFSVHGLYTFTNTEETAAQYRITFPFPMNVREISSLRIHNASKNREIPFEKRKTEILFPLTLQPRDTVDISISYRQKARSRNVYILTSTAAWNAPLRFATYSLAVARGMTVAGLSYAPDSSIHTCEGIVYYWSKKNFLPDREFIVRVRR